jgi:hypothetical protein
MKKIIFAVMALLSFFSFKAADAQVSVSLGINIGSQPAWGPVGYDYARYYYMPDIDVYYSVPTHQYVYYQNNAWIKASVLPGRYGNFDPYQSYKVVINEKDPWLKNNVYRTKYATYKGRHDQVIIRDSRDEKYRDHWDNGKHKGWDKQKYKKQKNEGGDDDHGNGHGKGHGHKDKD